MKFAIRLLLMMSMLTSAMFAQGTIRGTVTDAASKQPLPAVNISIVGTNRGTVSDADGQYSVSVDDGSYTVKASALGYAVTQKQITVSGGEAVVNFAMTESAIQVGEVVVEVNRAKERETPVAFSNIGSKEINQKINSQDAPLLLKGTPGVFSYSTDGVGNGESQMFVRGFNQNRVQVMINGVPTNDPESNAVYWSNWGAVSSAASSIQVQRGAGSSLYGSGSFGGSFNIVTQEVPSKFGGELHASFGDPSLMVFGGTVQSGLMGDNFAALSLRAEYKTGTGNRAGSYYEGMNYYTTVAVYPDDKSSVKLVMHGGPQEHTYSFNAPVAYFKRYGYDANPANFFSIDALTQTVGSKTLEDSLNLKGDARLLRDSKYIGLSHNFYHKPQLEVHYNLDVDEVNSVRGTFFYSVGRGGGSSVNGGSFPTSGTFGADTVGFSAGTSAYQNLDLETGAIKGDAAAANFIARRFLTSAFQRTSYSFHDQWGLIGSWDTKVNNELKITVGGEFRDWFADHPGHFTNMYGKKFVTSSSARYGWRGKDGKVKGTFDRRVYQGDLEFGGTDRMDVNYLNPFMGYTLSDDGGTYNTQYRNYVGETKQGTAFVQANYQLTKELNLLGSLQYVFYDYHIYENMPSESAVADSAGATAASKEGPDGQGNFYMASYANAAATTPNMWYKFRLVDVSRSRGFFQPKIGANYNLNENINIFGNFSHVERLVDLGVFYNSGNPNPDAEDEKSNQIEAGVAYRDDMSFAQLNFYTMSWENKTALITDVSKSGQPGYDRNGNRYELVGSSRNQGIEFEARYKLDEILNMEGFTVSGSFTAMDNIWTEVLDEVKIDKNTGKRRAFDTGSLTAAGTVDTLFFDELNNTVNASTPFTTISYGLTYSNDDWFATVTGLTTMNHYALDGGTYIAIDGSFDNSAVKKFTATYDNKLPSATIIDLQAGMFYNFNEIKCRLSAQIANVFNSEFLVQANRSGVLPGVSRSFRVNLAVGM